MIRVVGKRLEIRVDLFKRLDGPARPHVDVEKLKTSARRFFRSQDDGPKEVLLGLVRPRQPVVGRSENEVIVGTRVAQFPTVSEVPRRPEGNSPSQSTGVRATPLPL